MVLFLDDVQYCDIATMNVIQYILADSEVQHFLLIMAYRENEVDESTFLTSSLQRIGDTIQQRLHYINLKPLGPEEIGKWLIDTLNPISTFAFTDEPDVQEAEQRRCMELAEFCYRRSNGYGKVIFFLQQEIHCTFRC